MYYIYHFVHIDVLKGFQALPGSHNNPLMIEIQCVSLVILSTLCETNIHRKVSKEYIIKSTCTVKLCYRDTYLYNLPLCKGGPNGVCHIERFHCTYQIKHIDLQIP